MIEKYSLQDIKPIICAEGMRQEENIKTNQLIALEIRELVSKYVN